jgi:hypothetical protein
MRALLVVLLVLAAVGGAAWLLLSEPDGTSAIENEPESARSKPPELPDAPGPRAEAPRLGVVGPRDRELTADPDAAAWHTHMLRFPTGAGTRLTGRVLLEAVGEHLYVRAKDLTTLDQLRRHEFEMDVLPQMPMGAVVPLLERAGFAVHVNPPLFVFRRLTPAEVEARTKPADVDARPP